MWRWMRIVLLGLVVLGIGSLTLAEGAPGRRGGDAPRPGAAITGQVAPEDSGLKREVTITALTATTIDVYEDASHCDDHGIRIKPDTQRTLIRVDDVCPFYGATILEATLELYVADGGGQDVSTEVYKLCHPWDCQEADWIESAADVLWGMPGADLRGRCDDELDPPDLFQSRVTWLEHTPINETIRLDVTTAMQTWANDPRSNHGLLLLAKGPLSVRTFCSPTNPDHPAKLVVRYEGGSEIVPSELEITTSEDPIVACSADEAEITVRLVGQSGCPISSTASIELTTSLGWLNTPGTRTATLDTVGGQATARLLPGNIAGTAYLDATCSAIANSVSLACEIVPGEPVAYRFAEPLDREAGIPLPLRIEAIDCGGAVASRSNCDDVTLAITPTGSITPNHVSLVNGIWQGDVAISDLAPGKTLRFETDGCNVSGTSAPFNVLETGPVSLEIDCDGEFLTACQQSRVVVRAVDGSGLPLSGLDWPFSFGGACDPMTLNPEAVMQDGVYTGTIVARPIADDPTDIHAVLDYGARRLVSTPVQVRSVERLEMDATWSTDSVLDPTQYLITGTAQVADACGVVYAGRTVAWSSSYSTMVPVSSTTGPELPATSYLTVPAYPQPLVRQVDINTESGDLTATRRLRLTLPRWRMPLVIGPPCKGELVRDGGFEEHLSLPEGERYWQESEKGCIAHLAGLCCVNSDAAAHLGDVASITHVITQQLGTVGGCVELDVSFNYVHFQRTTQPSPSEMALELCSIDATGTCTVLKTIALPETCTNNGEDGTSCERIDRRVRLDPMNAGESLAVSIRFQVLTDRCTSWQNCPYGRIEDLSITCHHP